MAARRKEKDPVFSPPSLTGEYDELISTLLKNRGFEKPEEIEKFLNVDFDAHTYDPFLISDMDKAVERFLRAVSSGEKIVVYSDYDCDGIPGAAVLHDFLKKIGFENFYNYIPHRHREGYGLNREAVEGFAKDGVNLIITVDVGITDIEEVALAESFGMNIILTDHHLPVLIETDDGREIEKLPPAYAVLNSKRAGDMYPDRMLCGAAVGWKLVCAVIKKVKGGFGSLKNSGAGGCKYPECIQKIRSLPDGWEKWLLDLVGISTIADMVPLRDENRVLARYGLLVLRKTRRPGLKKLFEKTRINQGYLAEDDISFMIAPRLNAASRMDTPMDAFRLLTTEDEVEAERLANHLHNLNHSRKENVASIMKRVYEDLEKSELREVIVFGNPEWSPGVLGLIAAKVLDEHTRPVFVWGRGEDSERIKGSCRSPGEVSVVDIMANVRENFFSHVGGHELAGGFALPYDHVHELEKELLRAYHKVKKREMPRADSRIDGALPLGAVKDEVLQVLSALSPYGIGNYKPTFIFEGVVPVLVRQFGKEKNHLELLFEQTPGNFVKAVGFFMGPHHFEKERGVVFTPGVPVTLVAELESSYFRGKTEARLRIIDAR